MSYGITGVLFMTMVFVIACSTIRSQPAPPLEGTAMSNNRKIIITLPAVTYAIQGRTLQIFFRGTVDAINYLDHDIVVTSPAGNKFNRYYEVKPDALGDYPLVLSVRDDAKNVLDTKTSTLRVVPPPASPAENQNILCVGDSATDTAHWPAELKRMLTATGGEPAGLALRNITFVGRKSKAVPAGQVNYEATGGWSWNTFIKNGVKAVRFHVTGADGLQIDDFYQFESPETGVATFSIEEINVTEGRGNIRCIYRYNSPSRRTPAQASGTLVRIKGTGSSKLSFDKVEEEIFSPFFRNGAVDFRQYADDYCHGRIDILIAHLGVNSVLWEHASVDNVIADTRVFLDSFFSDFPSAKVILSAIPVPSQDGGLGSLYTTAGTINQYGSFLKFQEYNRALEALGRDDHYAGRVFFAASNNQVDSENVFPKKTKVVNTRMSETEIVGANPTHPNLAGSYMVADSILRTLAALLK